MNFLWELCVTYIHFKLFAKWNHAGKILLFPKMFWQEKKKLHSKFNCSNCGVTGTEYFLTSILLNYLRQCAFSSNYLHRNLGWVKGRCRLLRWVISIFEYSFSRCYWFLLMTKVGLAPTISLLLIKLTRSE